MNNIIVFFGGVSCEHEVSVITGVMTVNTLSKEGNKVYPVYVTEDGKMFTGENLNDLSFYKAKDFKKTNEVVFRSGENNLYVNKNGKLKLLTSVDCAINCMHGLHGEDGSISGLMQLLNIPLASPPMFASSLSMDKYYTKLILNGIDVNCLPYVKLGRDNYFKKRDLAEKFIENRLSYPVIVKPANLGSSIGITVVKSGKELKSALDNAFRYDIKVIVEKCLSGFKEINCACYKLEDKYITSECEEPVTKNDILTFDDKYKNNATKRFPADIEPWLSKKIRETTAYVYRKLDFQGIIRIDYLVKGSEVYLNEINSVPGSLAYYLFCKDSLEFSELLDKIVSEAIINHRSDSQREYRYVGGVFEGNLSKYKK